MERVVVEYELLRENELAMLTKTVVDEMEFPEFIVPHLVRSLLREYFDMTNMIWLKNTTMTSILIEVILSLSGKLISIK